MSKPVLKNRVIAGVAITSLLALCVLFGLDLVWYERGETTVSAAARELPSFWRALLCFFAGTTFGGIGGVLIGHFGWSEDS